VKQQNQALVRRFGHFGIFEFNPSTCRLKGNA
jgi:hypothetical protein